MDDAELQDEPLQVRLMDHDTYSANDMIGKVYFNLNPLLLNSSTEPQDSLIKSSHNSSPGWYILALRTYSVCELQYRLRFQDQDVFPDGFQFTILFTDYEERSI